MREGIYVWLLVVDFGFTKIVIDECGLVFLFVSGNNINFFVILFRGREIYVLSFLFGIWYER